jgi:hypothetical protein
VAEEYPVDPEIQAMSTIADALSTLDQQAITRVLKWASERYAVELAVRAHTESDKRHAEQSGGSAQPTPPDPTSFTAPSSAPAPATFNDFHELFDAANPSTSMDKALVAGYWFQVSKTQDDLDGFQLNKELKNLGHPSSNITRDLDHLINKTPRLAMQVRKDGSTKQARKKYKLTREGIKAVERMLSGQQQAGA